MKLLFDQNLSHKLCARLASVYPGSQQARLIGLATAADLDLWRHAAEHGFVLVSQDSDMAELSAIRGAPPKVVWLRCGNQPTEYIEDLLRRHSIRLHELVHDEEMHCLALY